MSKAPPPVEDKQAASLVQETPPAPAVPEVPKEVKEAPRQVSAPPVEVPEEEKEPPLALLSWRCSSEGHWSSIRGEVKNTSDKKLEHVTAVGTFRTASGEMVKTSMAMVEFNPIMPGQTSPFHVITTNNPEISKCEVNFKHLIGGQIAAKDMSQ